MSCHMTSCICSFLFFPYSLILSSSLFKEQNSNKQIIQRLQNQCRWTKLQVGFLKSNVDASFKGEDQWTKWGMSVCVSGMIGDISSLLDLMGGICANQLKRDWGRHITLGLLQAMKWVIEMGFTRVIFEMDNKLVVDKFNNSSL